VRKSNELPLKAAIEEFLNSYRLKDKLNETRLIQSWEKVVGPMIAKQTLRLQVRKRVLFVQVESAALKQELLYARSKLIIALNKEAGSNVIDEIVLN
jgi:predicted nucleic acid-binding Zn ribbon protein